MIANELFFSSKNNYFILFVINLEQLLLRMTDGDAIDDSLLQTLVLFDVDELLRQSVMRNQLGAITPLSQQRFNLPLIFDKFTVDKLNDSLPSLLVRVEQKHGDTLHARAHSVRFERRSNVICHRQTN
jgi:hypothetical protein